MISGKYKAPHRALKLVLLSLSGSLLAMGAHARDLSPAWVVEQLAQPVPSQTAFVEVRESAMLKAPLQVSGRYARPDAATLVREVQQPYRETSTIANGQVRVQREGRRDRVFPLDRAPELAGLQDSFAALLGGQLAVLERDFRLQVEGSQSQWRLVLTPHTARVAARLQDLTLHGSGDDLRCIEARPVKGALQRTLLGGTAQAAISGQVTDGAALQALCTGAAS